MPLTSKGEEIKKNMESEYGPKKGEAVFYASKNKGTISGVDSMLGGGCDAVPIAKCYDQSYPPMDPTSIGAMPTMERGADAETKHDPSNGQFTGGSGGGGSGLSQNNPRQIREMAEKMWEKETGRPISSFRAKPMSELGSYFKRAKEEFENKGGKDEEPTQPSGMQEPTDADPDRLQFKSHEARNPVEERRAERERLRGEEAALRAGPTGPEAPKDAFEPTTAGCDPAMSFDEAMFGPAAHDYGADKFSSMGGLPETVTHRQMQNFGASFNFGEGVTK